MSEVNEVSVSEVSSQFPSLSISQNEDKPVLQPVLQPQIPIEATKNTTIDNNNNNEKVK
jgi:hypothetical protein